MKGLDEKLSQFSIGCEIARSAVSVLKRQLTLQNTWCYIPSVRNSHFIRFIRVLGTRVLYLNRIFLGKIRQNSKTISSFGLANSCCVYLVNDGFY